MSQAIEYRGLEEVMRRDKAISLLKKEVETIAGEKSDLSKKILALEAIRSELEPLRTRVGELERSLDGSMLPSSRRLSLLNRGAKLMRPLMTSALNLKLRKKQRRL